MFISVLAHTKILFTERESETKKCLTKLRITLTTLQLAPGMHFLEDKENAIENAKDVKAIFSILRQHWKYYNYYLLQHLIQELGDGQLQQEMTQYVAELHRFEKATPVQFFPYANEDGERLQLEKRAVLIFKKDPSEMTLYDLRMVKEAIANEAAMEDYALSIESTGLGSVVLTLAFPRAGLELFAPALSPEFLAKHQITSVVIDDLPLEKYTQEYVKVNKCMK